MDAYAFALTLGTAGLAAMTVLGFHHGHAPGGSGHGHHSTHVRGGGRAGGHAGHQHHAATNSRLLLFLSPLAGLGEIVGPARRDGAEAPASPTKLPARPGRAAGE